MVKFKQKHVRKRIKKKNPVLNKVFLNLNTVCISYAFYCNIFLLFQATGEPESVCLRARVRACVCVGGGIS